MTWTTQLLTLAAALPLTCTLALAAPKPTPPPVSAARATVADLCQSYGLHAARRVRDRNLGMALPDALTKTRAIHTLMGMADPATAALILSEQEEIVYWVYATPALTEATARDQAVLACTRLWLPAVRD